MSQYLQRWLEDGARPTIRDGTYRLYEGLIRNHIAPIVGGVRLDRFTPPIVQSLYADLERNGASPRLREQVHNVLHRSLDQAVKWGMTFRNPVDAVDKPRVPRRSMQVWTADETRRFLDAAHEDRLYALYVLALTTGMRQGELLALQWDDIDLDAMTLSVRHTLLDNNGTPVLAEPKTEKSRRRIDLSPSCVVALRRHRAAIMAEGLRAAPWVFPDRPGHAMRKSNVVRRSFFPAVGRAGVRRIRFHDLRHTAATLMLTQGIHPKIVQERLGHASIGLTLDTYSHTLPSMQREAARKVDELLGFAV